MIGKFMIGKSFRGCLLYCLNDKLETGQQPTIKDRADVLLYNQCYGSDKELIQQFNDVRLLNQKVTKPVLHITLSLSPGEDLDHGGLAAIAEKCATHFGFEANQYVAIAHRDTGHQHLHIVANRIGLDGRTVSDSNSYQKMAAFCRKTEAAYKLKPVLSPKRFLPKEEQHLPRLDHRKELLKERIQQCLFLSQSYVQFEEGMQAAGYQILKGRGIAFLDAKGVKVKGSEVGYSLGKIQGMLEAEKVTQQLSTKEIQMDVAGSKINAAGKYPNTGEQRAQKNEVVRERGLEKRLNNAIDVLLSTEKEQGAMTPEWLKKKRKKKPHHPRL
ncbi:MAG TPA: relaxase/mobilization nuclease domain-containing protein [Flavisolibacter sp.]|nr:relaxase/mobilization nuclease domain-containing protein [Flavisolibacter sp.]